MSSNAHLERRPESLPARAPWSLWSAPHALLGLVLLCVAGGAHAAEAAEGEESVPDFILHHVVDSDYYEFEVPLAADRNVKITFPDWRIPLTAGGCPADRTVVAPVSQCLDLSLTKNTVFMMIAALLLLLVFGLASNRDRKKLVTRGVGANLIEMLVLFVRDEVAVKNIGKAEAHRYVNYLLSVFFFILFMNLLGLVPWSSTATSSLGVTAALAVCTFVITQIASIRAAGIGGYLKHLTGGVPQVWLWPIMIPVEIMGLFTKPFALTLRLFANMLAGHIIIFFLLGLIFIAKSAWVAVASVPMAIAIYFLEIFVAFLQAYIFAMLSALFIGMGVAMGHHGDEHEDHAGEPPAASDAEAHALAH